MNDLRAAVDRLTENMAHARELISDNTVRSLVKENALRDLPALETALAALCEKQQRERGCEWCNGAWETSDMDYITGVSEWDIDSMDFCPRCGRKLAEQWLIRLK